MGDRSGRKYSGDKSKLADNLPRQLICKLKKKSPSERETRAHWGKAVKLAFPFLRSRPRWTPSWVRPFSHLVSMRKNGLRNRQTDLLRRF